ncbi:YitT family protein [Jeotgalibacillus soli]|nr:YitT family protein [Jeotgalibacillus soli]
MAIIVGSSLLSLGLNGFLVPYQLLDGGIIGTALILHYYFNFQTGLCIILLSIPLFIYAWFHERIYFYNSLHGLLLSSLMIDWLAPLETQFTVPILPSSIIGGFLIGIGIGLMLRYETSTGGTDLLAQFISKWLSLNIGIVILIVDGFVVVVGYNVLGLQSFLYSSLTICVVGLMTSLIATKRSI